MEKPHGARAWGAQVYLHHFVTMDTLIVPPPTGQGIIARQAFEEPHVLVVEADRLTPPAKRCVRLRAWRASEAML